MIPRQELLEIVADDLRYLKQEWHESVEDSALRRGSAVLRRLLVQNELQRAWRMAGFASQPIVTASTLEPILQQIPLQKLAFAAAGGARNKGAELRGALIANYAMSEAEVKTQYEAEVPSAKMKLRDFVAAPCVVVSGELVTRHLLIKYIANKLGGVHYDPARSADERLFRLLDSAREKIMLLEKPAVYFELLSIGQAVASSEDIEGFLKTIGKSGAA